MTFPCTRCGKQRIVSKTWKEVRQTLMGETTIMHTETICPDPECQKKVDEQLAVAREKYLFHQKKKEDMLAARKKGNHPNPNPPEPPGGH